MRRYERFYVGESTLNDDNSEVPHRVDLIHMDWFHGVPVLGDQHAQLVEVQTDQYWVNNVIGSED